MRKRVLALSLVLALVMGITAQAAEPMRAPTKNLDLRFQGTTAICTASVHADNAADNISITVKLWHNGSAIKTWTKSGRYTVQLNESAPVVRGQTYQLAMTTTINGVQQPYSSITKVCP